MQADSSQIMLSRLDFTCGKYEELCRTIAASRYSAVTLAGYLRLNHDRNSKPYIIMRHDIDRSPRRALDAALIEHRHGIAATYYFRNQKGTYVPDLLDKIASLGHEIGLHYETVDKCRGDAASARALFQEELGLFRSRYEINTVCAHGNPLTRFDNKDIWKTASLSDFGLLGEAFLSLDYERFAYFSDSGRTWLNSESQKMPGKDCVKTAFGQWQPKTSDDVIEIIREGKLPNICILTHPERWTAGAAAFAGRYVLDTAFSWGKTAIHNYRKVRRL